MLVGIRAMGWLVLRVGHLSSVLCRKPACGRSVAEPVARVGYSVRRAVVEVGLQVRARLVVLEDYRELRQKRHSAGRVSLALRIRVVERENTAVAPVVVPMLVLTSFGVVGQAFTVLAAAALAVVSSSQTRKRRVGLAGRMALMLLLVVAVLVVLLAETPVVMATTATAMLPVAMGEAVQEATIPAQAGSVVTAVRPVLERAVVAVELLSVVPVVTAVVVKSGW